MKLSLPIKTFLALTIVVVVIVWFQSRVKSAEGFEAPSYEIPKIIWTYWDNPDTVPKAVKICMKTWKKYNPNHKIIMLNKKTYKDYVDIPDEVANHPHFNDFPARFADLVRIFLITQKGGVWCDASIIMGQPLDEWIKGRPNIELYGFTIHYGKIYNRYPILENWFFAAPPGSPFMQKWRDEFVYEMMKFPTHADYVQSREEMGVNLDEFGAKTYLAMHVAAQKLIQIDKYPLWKLALQHSEEGPFRLTHDTEWEDPVKAVRLVCNDPFYRRPFAKLRGQERAALENGIDGEFSNEKCKWY